VDEVCVSGLSPLAQWRGTTIVGEPRFEYLRFGPKTRGNPGLGAGVVIDDIAVYDEALPVLLSAEPRDVRQKLARRAAVAARQNLQVLASLRRGGLWSNCYHWPSLAPIWSVRTPLLVAHGAGSIRNASILLEAYEALGDPAYLDAARAVGDTIVANQSDRGSIPNSYVVARDGTARSRSGPATSIAFNDGPFIIMLRFLLYLHRVTGDDKYLAAAEKGCALILEAQSPYGGWPDVYSLTPRPRNLECSYEDGSFTTTFRFLLKMYHYSRKQVYLDALRKAACWPLTTQVQKGPCAGAYASVYTKDNQPMDGEHHFAPLCCTSSATLWCARLCLYLYDVTDDNVYLDAVERAAAFLSRAFDRHEKSVPEQWGDKLFKFYELETGRPVSRIFDKQRDGRAINLHLDRYLKEPTRYERFYLDTPEGRRNAAEHERMTVEQLMSWSWYRGWSCSREQLASLEKELRRARAAKRQRPAPRPKPTVAQYEALTKVRIVRGGAKTIRIPDRILEALGEMEPPGVWIGYAAEGASGYTIRWRRVTDLLRYVLASGVLDGEITPEQASKYGQWCTARDLFDTPLRKARPSSQPEKDKP